MRSSYREIIIVPFSKIPEIGKERIGIKGANLGELISMRVPVPNGLVITTDAFNRYFLSNHLYEFIKKELSVVDPADSVKLENVSKRIRNGVLKSKMDAELEKVIMKAYTSLSGFSDSYVAIRSSSNFENQGEGGGVQHSTFLNIKGKEDVVEKVKLCWASLFSPQNLFYILSQGHDILALKMAVIVQRMVQAEASGILFTINPIDNDSSKASIEAVLGLGEVLVEGQVTPDSYLIDKEDGEILEKHIVPQDWMLVRKGRTKRGEDPNIKVKVSNIWRTKQKLENKYMKKLFKVGVVIEDHFGEPQEIEWSYEGGKIWIIQTRPVINLQIEEDSWKKTPTLAALRSKVESSKAREDRVVLSQKQIVEGEKKLKKADARILLSGTGICGGGVSGKVKIVISPKQIGKEDKGIILVTPFITGDYLDKLGGVVAIITDEGGGDSDVVAAIKSLGFPCILNTQIATRVLRSGEFVTVSGDTGEVIAGKTREGLMNAEKFTQKRVQPKIKTGESKKTLEEQMPFVKEGKEQIKTATKVFLNVYDINLVQSMAKINADGVVIFDSEQIMREAGVHPQLALKRRGGKDQIVTAFDLGLFRIARSFEHVPVIYKLSNMLSSDYSNLQGGSEFEVVEENPILGLRGASRYISNPEEVKLELEAIRNLRNKENLRNVWLAVPYIRTYRELREMKHLISDAGFKRSSTFKIFMVVEVPSSVIRIEKLLDIGIDGVIVDLDTLSQLILGIDKVNPKLQGSYEDDHPAVLWAVEKVIKACNKAKVHSLIKGRILTANPKIVRKFVKWGVTSVVVSPDEQEQIRESIADAEGSLFSKRKR